jgi:hypothetical protein
MRLLSNLPPPRKFINRELRTKTLVLIGYLVTPSPLEEEEGMPETLAWNW